MRLAKLHGRGQSGGQWSTCQALQGVGLGWLDWLKLGRRVLYRTPLLYGAHMLQDVSVSMQGTV